MGVRENLKVQLISGMSDCVMLKPVVTAHLYCYAICCDVRTIRCVRRSRTVNLNIVSGLGIPNSGRGSEIRMRKVA